jgi:hydrogenase maturation factor
VPDHVLERARRLLFDPGISIVREAILASDTASLHAMHDPTEGGLATGIAELAQASGTGVRVYEDRIPMLAETRALCAALDINPLGLLASGALLIAAEPGEASLVSQALARENIACSQIGELVPP